MYNPSSENERETLSLLASTKEKIKRLYKTDCEFDISQINNFYSNLKKSNQLFYFLTNKDHDCLFLKFQTQKILFYLIQLLMKNEPKQNTMISKEDVLKVRKLNTWVINHLNY